MIIDCFFLLVSFNFWLSVPSNICRRQTDGGFPASESKNADCNSILHFSYPATKNPLFPTKRVIRHEPLGFHDYNKLQMNAYAVVSDSGTLPEESSYFTSIGKPFPAVCIRTSTERPEALDKGCFVLAGIDEKSLLQAVETAVRMNDEGDYGIPVPDYTDENVSTKAVKLIQSYTSIVNKMVWRKF